MVVVTEVIIRKMLEEDGPFDVDFVVLISFPL